MSPVPMSCPQTLPSTFTALALPFSTAHSVRSYTRDLAKLLNQPPLIFVRPAVSASEKIHRRERDRLCAWAHCPVRIKNASEGATLITNDLQALNNRDRSVLFPKGEHFVDRQNFRRFLIPLGQDETGIYALYGCLKLALAMKATLVYYHTTWRKPGIASSDPWDHMTEKSRRVLCQAIALAQREQLPYEVALEIEAPGVPEGIVRAANAHQTCLIAMNYSSFNRKGSKAETVAAITNIPLLVVGNDTAHIPTLPANMPTARIVPPHDPTLLSPTHNPWLTIKRVMGIAILLTVIKAIAKIILGNHLASRAITADGYHSLSDAVPDAIVMWAATLAQRHADRHYPFGRGNINNLITLGTGLALLVVCATIGFNIAAAFYHVWRHEPVASLHISARELPYALGITLLSAFISFGVGYYQMYAGRKMREPSLSVDGAEMKSDGLIELTTAGGLGGAYLFNAPWIEYLLGTIMIYFVGKTAYEFLTSGMNGLLQKSLGTSIEHDIRQAIAPVPGLAHVRELKTFAIGATTAVVMLKIEIALGVRGAVVQTAIRRILDAYFSTTEDFGRHEIWIEESDPAPTERIAIGVTNDFVAPRLAEAREIFICETRTNGEIVTINQVAIHHLSYAERIDLLARKKVRSLILFFADETAQAQLRPHQIATLQSLTLSPDTLFTQ